MIFFSLRYCMLYTFLIWKQNFCHYFELKTDLFILKNVSQ